MFKKLIEKLIENWIVASAVIVILIGINLLYIKNSLMIDNLQKIESPVFRTYKTIGNCFYKSQDSMKWLFLSGEEILAMGSDLQTDADSHAILSFIGQSGKVEISEKTHLRILRQGKDTVIDFQKGEIYINYQASSGQKPLLVKVNQKIFKLTNADLYITGDIEEGTQVAVEYGRTTMQIGDQANAFEKGQVVSFKNDREYAVGESLFRIRTPFNYDRYNLESKEFKVRFAFDGFQEDYQFQILAGNIPNKMIPLWEKPKTLSKNEFAIPFKKGAYYWQLVGYQNGVPKISSHVKKFFVEPQSVIQLVKPIVGSKFQLIDGKAFVQFQWDNPSQLEKVFIEISDRSDFSKTLINESIAENNYYNHFFEKTGEYFWRVSGFPFGTSDLIPSAAGKIAIVDEVIPQQVRIIFPRAKTILTTTSLKSSDITFQWTKNPATSEYSVQIQSLKDGRIVEHKTKETTLKIKDLLPGSYEWKVSDKNSNLTSKPELFSVVQTRRLNFSQSEEPGYLRWRAGPRGTVQYRVEALRIGSRSDFNAFFDDQSSTKKSLEIKGDRISYKNFSDGIYAFKIYALDTDKNILADSNLKFLKVGQKTNLQ